MNKYLTTLIVFLILFLSQTAAAQKSVSDLPPAHASALQQFLKTHEGLELLSETATDQSSLKDMRENFGARFRPFYRAGDFNNDGVADFAMILVKKGGPTGDQGVGIAESHRFLYDVTIVIFNGARGTYQPVFVKTTKAPLVCLLNVTTGKKKSLTFGIYETDDSFIMKPSRKGYLVDHR